MAQTVITIFAEGAHRKLLTIQERASGDLTLIIKHSSHGPNLKRILEERLSIHYSPSSENVCSIKSTLTLADGKIVNYQNMIKSVKKGSGFNAVMSRRCNHVALDDYYKYDKRSTNLGGYDPKAFQLFYSIFTGESGDKFFYYQPYTANLIQIDYRVFTIVIVWSFATYPSDVTGRTYIATSKKPEDIALVSDPVAKNYYLIAPYGIDEHSCLAYFRYTMMRSLIAYFERMRADMPNIQQSVPLLLKIASGLDALGSTNSIDYREHVRRVFVEQIFDKSPDNFRSMPIYLGFSSENSSTAG